MRLHESMLLASVSAAGHGARPAGRLRLVQHPRGRASISISAFDITNAVRQEYQGVEDMARRQDYDGRTYRVALNMKF